MGKGSLLASVLAELASLNGLIAVLLVSVLIAVSVYPSYAVSIIGSAGGMTFSNYSLRSIPGAEQFYSKVFLRYDTIFLRGLKWVTIFAAPLVAGLAVAYPIESREDRFSIMYVTGTRAKLYLARSIAVSLWIVLPVVLFYLFIPFSLSVTNGVAMIALGLLERSVRVAVFTLVYVATSIFASIVAGRMGVAILAGIVLSILLGSVQILWSNVLASLLTALLFYVAGFIVYSRRDL